jgi:transmembrane sensor
MKLEWDIIVRNLKNEASEEDQLLLNTWLQESNHAAEFRKIQEIWKRTGKVQDSYKPNLDASWTNIEERAFKSFDKKTIPIKYYQWIGKVAAILVLAIVSIFLLIKTSNTEDHLITNITFMTTLTKDSIQLEDGTKIWLNRNSKVIYPKAFSKGERRITLLGEGYFEVAKDTNRPFIIESGQTITTVLGTSFNINTEKSNTRISVFTGKVAFSDFSSQDTLFLSLGETGIYKNGLLDKSINNDPNLLAWKTGLLIFENTPLGEVETILSNYYNQPINIKYKDPSHRLTASFYRQNIDEALKVISITLDLELSKIDNEYILN